MPSTPLAATSAPTPAPFPECRRRPRSSRCQGADSCRSAARRSRWPRCALFLQRERLRRQFHPSNRGDAVRHVELVDLPASGALRLSPRCAEVETRASDTCRCRRSPHRSAPERGPRRHARRSGARMRAIRLRSMTTFIGPAGAVPSITMTLVMVNVGNGPRPSPARRSGAGTSRSCCAISRIGEEREAQCQRQQRQSFGHGSGIISVGRAMKQQNLRLRQRLAAVFFTRSAAALFRL